MRNLMSTRKWASLCFFGAAILLITIVCAKENAEHGRSIRWLELSKDKDDIVLVIHNLDRKHAAYEQPVLYGSPKDSLGIHVKLIDDLGVVKRSCAMTGHDDADGEPSFKRIPPGGSVTKRFSVSTLASIYCLNSGSYTIFFEKNDEDKSIVSNIINIDIADNELQRQQKNRVD